MPSAPIHSLRPNDVYAALETGPEGLSAEEAGSRHCQNDRLGVAIPFMHDWLAEKLKG